MQRPSTLIICVLTLIYSVTSLAQDRLYQNQFPLENVQLLDGPFRHARDLNMKVLLSYDADRLLAGYRKQAGLTAKAASYANWDGLDGHVAGHYLSALAMNYASTKDLKYRNLLSHTLAELDSCQIANALNHPDWGVGYLGAVPNSQQIWSTYKTGDFAAFKAAWVPFYNIHKMYAGLRDVWLFTGNEKAKKMFLKFCDWAITISASLSDAQMQSILDIEHGGMNEVLADAFSMTGEEQYLLAAKRFSHQMLLGSMAKSVDNLDNKHANTQVPKAIGFARIGELGRDEEHTKAASFFWHTVVENRTLAFGGNSRREFFPSAASSFDFVHEVEGPESCNSYNMLKLTEDLFRMAPDAAYIDYYERTLFNHILSTQHPVHGGYVYFTPVRPQHYRVYSSPNQAMWCCVGSGMENHGKYNEMIYTHRNDSLYLNLFIPSRLTWKEKNLTLVQTTKFPFEESTTITVAEGGGNISLMVRRSGWLARPGMQILVNGKAVSSAASGQSYVAIRRNWRKGDVVKISLPMKTSSMQLPNVSEYVAFTHGPIVLAAVSGKEALKGLVADDSRWGHIAGGERIPLTRTPVVIRGDGTLEGQLRPVPGKPLHFKLATTDSAGRRDWELLPFFQLHDARYILYWMALSENKYQQYRDSLTALEAERAALDNRTVDIVHPGEQQPEVDHQLQKQNSNTGNFMDEFWRDARNGGFFSYRMSTNADTSLNLMVKYWGAERGDRKFEIYIDDTKLAIEDNTGRWNTAGFKLVEYPIPASALRGKSAVTVKFQGVAGSTAGAVYLVRLLKPRQ